MPSKSGTVAYFNPNGYLGGAERFVLEAATGHIKYGHFKPFVLFFNDGPAVSEFQDRGIPCAVLKNKFRLSRPLSLLRAAREIKMIGERHNWDVINATMPYAHLLASLAFPFVNSPKKVWFQHGPVGGFLDLIASAFSYDRILFNSKYTQSVHESQALFQNDVANHFVCPLGIPKLEINSNQSEALRASLLPEGKDIFLLTAGRICSWKSYETSIKALARLQKQRSNLKTRVHLFIAGDVKSERDQPYRDSLNHLVTDLRLENDVTFLGHRTDLSNLMQASDFYLHTSNIPEPFGLVVAEAMMAKAFVIGTNQGGTTDMLFSHQTGIAFDSISEEADKFLYYALEDGINYLINDPEKYQEICHNGLSFINENFNIPMMIENLEKHYE